MRAATKYHTWRAASASAHPVRGGLVLIVDCWRRDRDRPMDGLIDTSGYAGLKLRIARRYRVQTVPDQTRPDPTEAPSWYGYRLLWPVMVRVVIQTFTGIAKKGYPAERPSRN